MRYGSSLVPCLALLALASRGEAGSSPDSGSENPVVRQLQALETEAQRGDAYDADDEGPLPEGSLPTPNDRGKWPRERLYAGRAVRPAPFSRGAPAPGPLEDGRRENAPVSHRAGLARPALRPSEKASLALAGLVRTTNQSSNEGANAPGGSDGHHPQHQGRDHVPAWSMADASESTSDELDRACRLPVGAERRLAFSIIRKKIEARKQQTSATWNPFTLLSQSGSSVPLGYRRSDSLRTPVDPQSPLLRETSSERRKRRAP